MPTNMGGNFRRRSFRKVLYYVLLDSQTVFRGKPTCVNIIMKFDVLLWVLVTLSAILGFLFFGSLIWILIYKIMRKFLKNNNNELNLLPQIEAITNQPLMELQDAEKETTLDFEYFPPCPNCSLIEMGSSLCSANHDLCGSCGRKVR